MCLKQTKFRASRNLAFRICSEINSLSSSENAAETGVKAITLHSKTRVDAIIDSSEVSGWMYFQSLQLTTRKTRCLITSLETFI